METKNKRKILSIRVKEELGDLLKERATSKEMQISKYVRKLIKNDLGYEIGSKKILRFDLDFMDYELLQKKAKKSQETPVRYVKRLVKQDLMGSSVSGKVVKDQQLMDEHESLKREHSALLERHEEKNKESNKLKKEKEELLNDLLFLMNFFQTNAKVLQEKNYEFFVEHREEFASIAKKLKEAS